MKYVSMKTFNNYELLKTLSFEVEEREKDNQITKWDKGRIYFNRGT